MMGANRIRACSLVLVLIVLISVSVSCSEKPEDVTTPSYIEMQTGIEVNSGSAESIVERDGYSFVVSRLSVEVVGKAEFTKTINAELDEWLKKGVAVCESIIASEENGERAYRVVNSVTHCQGGMLSLCSSLEYSEYGETMSRTLNSAVWDLGREEKITVSKMFNMGEADLENFLTLNLYHIALEHPESYPKYLVSSVGECLKYTDYYVTSTGIYLYASNKNIKHPIEDIGVQISFSELPDLFNYDISAE